MKYFIDFEFLEGDIPQKICGFTIPRWLSKPHNTIQPISLGIISEDNREYYAISKDFNLEEAWNRFQVEEQTPFEKRHEFSGKKVYWIRENVLKPIWIDLFLLYEVDFTFLKGKAYDAFEQELKNGEHDKLFTFKSFKALVNRYGKTNKEIADEIVKFVYPNAIYKDIGCKSNDLIMPNCADSEKPKFYAYYADYDWVVFCQLFGKMIDLPNGFPKYCNDLKQELDRKVINAGCCITEESFEWQLDYCKRLPNYPKQENEHSAIHDARWNKKLHEFLKSI